MENLERFGMRNDVVNRSATGHDENLRRNLQFGERTTIRVFVGAGLEHAPTETRFVPRLSGLDCFDINQ
jgi:hypothetical protein